MVVLDVIRAAQVRIGELSPRTVRRYLLRVDAQRRAEGRAGFLSRTSDGPAGKLLVNLALLREACPTLDLLALATRDDLAALRTELVRVVEERVAPVETATRQNRDILVRVRSRLRTIEGQLRLPFEGRAA